VIHNSFFVKHNKKTLKSYPKDMNTKRLLWVRLCCLGDRNMSVGKATWSNSKQSSWNTLSFIIMLQIWYEYVVVNLIQLTCRSKYVSRQASWIKYKSISSNTFQKISSLMLLCCWIMFCNFYFFTYFIHHENPSKFKLKHNAGLFGLYNLKSFRLYNLKAPRLCGLWCYTQGLDELWCV
jgi:hypothetical protein